MDTKGSHPLGLTALSSTAQNWRPVVVKVLFRTPLTVLVEAISVQARTQCRVTVHDFSGLTQTREMKSQSLLNTVRS
jgi:hypothetical protein